MFVNVAYDNDSYAVEEVCYQPAAMLGPGGSAAVV